MRLDLALYVLVDPEHTGGRALVDLARMALEGGATVLQYRDKTGATRDMVDTARALKMVLAGTGVPLLINDRVDVALAAGADGVHIGQEDMRAADTRRLLGPRAIVGLTVKTEADVSNLPIGSIDYAAVGAVFATITKVNATAPIGIAGFARLRSVVAARAPNLPVVAIAGIDAGNAGALAAAGANGVAVVSAVTKAVDPRASARAIRAAFEAGKAGA